MQNRAKDTLFVRPNLKLFVLAALGLLVIDQLFSSDSSDSILAVDVEAAPLREHELEQLIERTYSDPNVEDYTLISEAYWHRGETQKAMLYLRKAGLAVELEETD